MLYLKIRVNTIQIPTSSETDHLWAKEAEWRIQEIDNGTVELIPGEEVFKKKKGSFSKRVGNWQFPSLSLYYILLLKKVNKRNKVLRYILWVVFAYLCRNPVGVAYYSPGCEPRVKKHTELNPVGMTHCNKCHPYRVLYMC